MSVQASVVQIGCCDHDPHTLVFQCPACGDMQFVNVNERRSADAPFECDDCEAELELLVRRKSA